MSDSTLVGADTSGEPQGNFLLGALNAIRAMADIATNINTIVTTDSSGSASQGIGFTEHLAASLDDILALPDHGENGSTGHKVNETGEEGLSAQVSIVLVEELARGSHHLGSQELETALLKTTHNLTNLPTTKNK